MGDYNETIPLGGMVYISKEMIFKVLKECFYIFLSILTDYTGKVNFFNCSNATGNTFRFFGHSFQTHC